MCKRPGGFTLLELMTAIAVLAVLLGIGVPAFTNIIRNNQIASEGGNLMAALTIARSEALTRGIRVSVCAAATPTTCAGAADWSSGWLVFADDFGAAGVLDPSDDVLQTWVGPANGVTVASARSSVTFTRTGSAELDASFDVLKSGCHGDQRRQIQVAPSGRVSLSRAACP